jgi:hypothetical protein
MPWRCRTVQHRQAVGQLASILFAKDAEAAKALVAGLPAADWRDPSVFSEFFQSWLESEPERAAELLLKRFPTDAQFGRGQERAYEWMFDRWSAKHPREASELFLKLPNAIGSKLLENALSFFTSGDAAGAGAWAAALPPGATREKALAQVAENWTRSGVAPVTQWLDTLPPDSGKFAAIEGFAKAIISTSPDEALAWIHAVPSENERLDRLCRVWRAWTDREAAEQWVETSRELTDAERAALQRISKTP